MLLLAGKFAYTHTWPEWWPSSYTRANSIWSAELAERHEWKSEHTQKHTASPKEMHRAKVNTKHFMPRKHSLAMTGSFRLHAGVERLVIVATILAPIHPHAHATVPSLKDSQCCTDSRCTDVEWMWLCRAMHWWWCADDKNILCIQCQNCEHVQGIAMKTMASKYAWIDAIEVRYVLKSGAKLQWRPL